MKTRKHIIYVHLRNGERKIYEVYAATRQEAKWFMYNRIYKWACYGKNFVGAYIPKFNPQKFLAQESA